MSLNAINAKCRSCATAFSGVPKRSFLGFQRLLCPKCSKEVLYPLTKGYRITYWVVAVWMTLAVIGGLAEGRIVLPGLLGIGTIVALVRDRTLKRDVDEATGRKMLA